MYPYDENRGGSTEETLKTCFKLSYELMHLLEPLGQASSSYEDTGDPERIALGIRSFMSSIDNLHMLRDIGEGVLKRLTDLGCVAEFIKKYGAKTEHDEETVKLWEELSSDLKKTETRTYNVVMSGVKEYMKKFKKDKPKKNICKMCGLPPDLCVCKEFKEQSENHNKRLLSDLKKKATEKSKNRK